ncbi:hypothetical protein N5923_19875 [Erwiniaceae bacterium BAC15a-03b]|uniref:Uncharacterized protein n=1 Tax=Winslowiella arboricola TaxID=2978220 RepID=A0A9J6Q0G6_9GAMM|nr:hypothetical protein [Winslowiella arboricola]MCU5772455.1 hypothetical protein [Winslowiella arboricola]MCU5779751.1 hypothetical protein [Winslowiella arboricola]
MVDKLMHRDFVEIGRLGQSYTREQILTALECPQSETEASDFALAMIADGMAFTHV